MNLTLTVKNKKLNSKLAYENFQTLAIFLFYWIKLFIYNIMYEILAWVFLNFIRRIFAIKLLKIHLHFY